MFVADIREFCLLGADFLKAVNLGKVFDPIFGGKNRRSLLKRLLFVGELENSLAKFLLTQSPCWERNQEI